MTTWTSLLLYLQKPTKVLHANKRVFRHQTITRAIHATQLPQMLKKLCVDPTLPLLVPS